MMSSAAAGEVSRAMQSLTSSLFECAALSEDAWAARRESVMQAVRAAPVAVFAPETRYGAGFTLLHYVSWWGRDVQLLREVLRRYAEQQQEGQVPVLEAPSASGVLPVTCAGQNRNATREMLHLLLSAATSMDGDEAAATERRKRMLRAKDDEGWCTMPIYLSSTIVGAWGPLTEDQQRNLVEVLDEVLVILGEGQAPLEESLTQDVVIGTAMYSAGTTGRGILEGHTRGRAALQALSVLSAVSESQSLSQSQSQSAEGLLSSPPQPRSPQNAVSGEAVAPSAPSGIVEENPDAGMVQALAAWMLENTDIVHADRMRYAALFVKAKLSSVRRLARRHQRECSTIGCGVGDMSNTGNATANAGSAWLAELVPDEQDREEILAALTRVEIH